MAISQVIQSEVGNHILVWKHPEEDFNTTSQLIVHESQEAILFRNGQALDLFPAGRYTLKTENIPILRKVINLATGGVTPFHCEVYFVNKTDSMDVMWGTKDRVPVMDPVHGLVIAIGANGQFAVRVEESRKLLIKMVGTIPVFDQETLTGYFRGILMSRIRNYLSDMVTKKGITILELNSHLNEMSEEIASQLEPHFAEYGIRLVNFYVNAIMFPEDDPSYLKLQQTYADTFEMKRMAEAKRYELDTLGTNIQQERTFDVLDRAASNEGGGASVMGAGMGLGMGMNMGTFFGGAMGGAMTNVTGQPPQGQDPGMMQPQNGGGPQPPANPQGGGTEPAKQCGKCGAEIPENGKFCLQCGEAYTPPAPAGSVVCPACGENTLSGKFCLQCGAKLQSGCPNCDAPLPPGAKFCSECGEKLV